MEGASFDLTQITGHGLSVGAIIGSLFGWAPPVAAIAAFVWYLIQIYESKYVQRFLHNRRIRKLAKLRKEIAYIEAAELIRNQPHPDHHKKHER